MQQEDDDETGNNFNLGAALGKGAMRAIGDELAGLNSGLNAEVAEDEFGDSVNLMDIDTSVSDEEFVRLSIERAKKLFRKEAGRADTKRANLGDIKSTRVNVPPILQQPLFSCSESEAATTMISGNIKAMVPLFREHLHSGNETVHVNLLKF